jgi:hypothetical protein
MMSTNAKTTTTENVTTVIEPKDMAILNTVTEGEYENGEFTEQDTVSHFESADSFLLFVPTDDLFDPVMPRQLFVSDNITKAVADSLEIVIDGTIECTAFNVIFIKTDADMITSNSIDWLDYSAENYHKQHIEVTQQQKDSYVGTYNCYTPTAQLDIPLLTDVMSRTANGLAINIDLLQLQTTISAFGRILKGPAPNGLCMFNHIVIELISTSTTPASCDIKSVTVSKIARVGSVVEAK